ncbi:MAG: hypothetical protein ABJB17_04920, partial [Burkholderiales bacterium]
MILIASIWSWAAAGNALSGAWGGAAMLGIAAAPAGDAAAAAQRAGGDAGCADTALQPLASRATAATSARREDLAKAFIGQLMKTRKARRGR